MGTRIPKFTTSFRIQFFVVLLLCGIVSGCPRPPKSRTPHRDKKRHSPLPEQVVQAWEDAGAKARWIGLNHKGRFEYRSTRAGLFGELPTFWFYPWKEGILKELPDPGMPFGLSTTGKVPNGALEELFRFKNLFALDLGEARMTGDGLKGLAKLKSLQWLILHQTHRDDKDMKEISGLTALDHLDLGETRITNRGLKELKGLSVLQSLDLQSTLITDVGLQELTSMRKLYALSLQNTRISDVGVKKLAVFQNLHTLNLGGTEITDDAVEDLAAMTTLRKLTVRGTKITDTGAKRLRRALRNCRIYH